MVARIPAGGRSRARPETAWSSAPLAQAEPRSWRATGVWGGRAAARGPSSLRSASVPTRNSPQGGQEHGRNEWGRYGHGWAARDPGGRGRRDPGGRRLGGRVPLLLAQRIPAGGLQRPRLGAHLPARPRRVRTDGRPLRRHRGGADPALPVRSGGAAQVTNAPAERRDAL